MVGLDERDEAVLAVVRNEHTVNPLLIRERTGLDKGDVNTVLTRLAKRGEVEQVTTGLYRYAGDEPVASEAVRTALWPLVDELAADAEALKAEHERGDWQYGQGLGFEKASDRLADALRDLEPDAEDHA